MRNSGLIVTVVLAALGYLATYVNSVRLENRKSRLKFLNDQIQFLYGPLYSLSHASQQAWHSFRSRYRPEKKAYFDPADPATDVEIVAWRNWMIEVFMPLNLQMEKAIVENAHLIEGSKMPKPFLDLLAHVETYRAVLHQWSQQDYSEYTARLEYPVELNLYAAETYHSLSAQQTHLLHSFL